MQTLPAPFRKLAPGLFPVPGPDAIAEADLRRLLDDHAALQRLCDALECVADSLPDPTMRAAALQLCREVAALHESHAAREADFLGAAFADARAAPLGAQLLAHIADRHTADSLHVQDIIAALEAPGAAPAAATLGYMLRCFFDGCRRSMNFEVLALLTLGRARLSVAARARLIATLDGG